MGKAFWKSKTLWFNAIAGLVTLLQAQTGTNLGVTPAEQTALIVVVNMALRLATKGAVTLS